MPSRRMKQLMALLATERTILQDGDLTKLDKITPQKDALTRDIAQLQLSAADAREMQAAAQRNADLLSAALAGVKEARARLTALEEVQSGLSIYDSQGGKQTVAQRQGQLERKA